MTGTGKFTVTWLAVLVLAWQSTPLLAEDAKESESDKPAQTAQTDRTDAQESEQVLAGPEVKDKPEKAGGRGFGGKRHHGRRAGAFKKAFAGLEVTDEQQSQLRAAGAEFRKKFKVWRNAHQEELKALRKQFKAAHESRDRDKIKELRNQRQALMADAPSRKDMMDQIKTILSDEQVVKLQENMKKMKKAYRGARKRKRCKRRGDTEEHDKRKKPKGTDGEQLEL